MLTPRCGLRPNSPTATTSVSFEQAALVQVGDQRREAGVEHRGRTGSSCASVRPTWTSHEWLSELATFGQIDFDDARAGFDQPPGQQAALAERVAAVAVAQSRRLLCVEVERLAGPAAR